MLMSIACILLLGMMMGWLCNTKTSKFTLIETSLN